MKSMREMRDELLNVRVSAANQSIWNIVVPIVRRAEVAINQGLRVYEFNIQGTYNSLLLSTAPQALPSEIERIAHVYALSPDTRRRIDVTEWRHMPTPFTNVLEVFQWPANLGGTEIHYEKRVSELPTDVYVINAIADTHFGVAITGAIPAHTWPKKGFIEFSLDNTSGREVAYYQNVLPTGFTNLVRGVEGIPTSWPVGTRVSAVAELPNECVAVVMAYAEGQMYRYWVANRSTYDTYAAWSGLSMVDVQDLAQLATMADQNAERIYRKLREPPKPGQARR